MPCQQRRKDGRQGCVPGVRTDQGPTAKLFTAQGQGFGKGGHQPVPLRFTTQDTIVRLRARGRQQSSGVVVRISTDESPSSRFDALRWKVVPLCRFVRCLGFPLASSVPSVLPDKERVKACQVLGTSPAGHSQRGHWILPRRGQLAGAAPGL